MNRRLIIRLRDEDERRAERVRKIITDTETKVFSHPDLPTVQLYDISNNYPINYPGLYEEDIKKIKRELSTPNLFGIEFSFDIIPSRFYETYLRIRVQPRISQEKEAA